MAGVNICNREHLSPLVMTLSFKMDARNGQLANGRHHLHWSLGKLSLKETKAHDELLP